MLAARGTCVCGEVVQVMPLSQATVSQHLKVLKEAGLIRGTVRRPNFCYCLDPRGIGELRTALDALLGGLSGAAGRLLNPRGDRRHEDRRRDRALVRERYAAISERPGEICAGRHPAAAGRLMAPDGART